MLFDLQAVHYDISRHANCRLRNVGQSRSLTTPHQLRQLMESASRQYLRPEETLPIRLVITFFTQVEITHPVAGQGVSTVLAVLATEEVSLRSARRIQETTAKHSSSPPSSSDIRSSHRVFSSTFSPLIRTGPLESHFQLLYALLRHLDIPSLLRTRRSRCTSLPSSPSLSLVWLLPPLSRAPASRRRGMDQLASTMCTAGV